MKLKSCDISFTRGLEEWNESTTIKCDDISIAEVHIHKNRDCCKTRFNLTKLFDFLESENIIEIEPINSVPSLNYIGSKKKLVPDFLRPMILKHIPDIKERCLIDLFAGTSIVSFGLKEIIKNINTNDYLYFLFIRSAAILHKYNNLTSIRKIQMAINHINFDIINNFDLDEFIKADNFDENKYFIYNNYRGKYFANENALLIDLVRQEIERYRENPLIYNYLIMNLIAASDKIANVASVYGAYLKDIKKTAKEKLYLENFCLFDSLIDKTDSLINRTDSSINKINSHIDKTDSFINKTKDLINQTNIESKEYSNKYCKGQAIPMANYFLNLEKQSEKVIIYLDPPYNQRRYDSNYHILETIAKYDNPELHGKTGLRNNGTISQFNSKPKVKDAFIKLFIDIFNHKEKNITVALSYNDQGILPIEELIKICKSFGKTIIETYDYKSFSAGKTKKENPIEYLIFISNV